MKEFNYTFENIFKGLVSLRGKRKIAQGLLQCHNLEPIDDDYEDIDYWLDDNNADWEDNNNDNWLDN